MLLWLGAAGLLPPSAIPGTAVLVGGPRTDSCGPLSHRYVNRGSRGLSASGRGSVLVLLGEGLELREGDCRGRRRRVASSEDPCLLFGMKQSRLGLLPPTLKHLSPLGVGCERSLGQLARITPGRGVRDWSRASLAGPIGAVCDKLCLFARALRCRLDRRGSVLLGHVCLCKVIRISQSS